MPKKTKKIAAGQASLSSKGASRSSASGRSFGESKGESSQSGSVNPETLSNDKLVKMGLIDLRMTRPPKPDASAKADSEDNANEKAKLMNKTKYQELVNSVDLNDEPPPPVKLRRVDAASLKAHKERKVFGEDGEGTGGGKYERRKPKNDVPFANIDAEGIQRLRAMLNNFCRKEDGTFFDDINLRSYGIDSGQPITNGVVQELCTIQPTLTRLDLSYCTLVSDVGLWAIARHCRFMKELTLQGCDTITNIGLRSLSLALLDVHTLNFNHCHLLDDIGLTVIATGKWKLAKLYLSDCVGITDNGVAKLARAHPTLQVLDLNGCSNVGEFGDKAIKEIATFCGGLRYLDLGGCRRVEDGGMRALAVGCPHLETLKLGGCDILTSISLKSICKHSKSMENLLLGGCKKFTDTDFENYLPSCVFRESLTSLDLSGCSGVGDRGIAVVCKVFGSNLYNLGMSGANVTDFSSMIIGEMCKRLRTLDMSACSRVTDESVHTCSRKISGLTTLKLDGTRATTRTLVSYTGSSVEYPLEFCEMANKWLGYQPKPDVAGLIVAREIFRLHTKSTLAIQCALRRKFAYKRYWIRRRWWLMTKIIPVTQARVRGMIQRIKFAEIKYHLFKINQAIKIQSIWRRFVAIHGKALRIKRIKFEEYRLRMAIRIQKRFRGMVDRGLVIDVRNNVLNRRVRAARKVAKLELNAIIIQRSITAWLGRVRAEKRIKVRISEKKRQALKERMMRTVQRIARGRLGRKRAHERRDEIAHDWLRWTSARLIQKSYRGLLGRRRFRWFLEEYIKKVKNDAATYIQKMFRGYRGKILGAIARQLKILRLRKAKASVMIQRNVRGMIGRESVKHYKENIIREIRRKKAAILVQRIFRGHKGKEARAIETALRDMERKAKPLVDLIKRLESDALTQTKQIARIEAKVKASEDELFLIERELAMCMQTTSKYCDTTRINNTPQRFLTKYLRVRLKDHYEHEKALHLARHKEMTKKKSSIRGFDMEIEAARRELLPLTTGVVIHVKNERTKMLRKRVRGRNTSAVTIQALWRRAIVRVAYSDPMRDYWIECYDLEQSDKPYYYNTYSEETVWKVPLAFKYFGNRAQEEEEEEETDSDDD